MLQWSIVQLSVYLSGGLTPATETSLLPTAYRDWGHLTLRYTVKKQMPLVKKKAGSLLFPSNI